MLHAKKQDTRMLQRNRYEIRIGNISAGISIQLNMFGQCPQPFLEGNTKALSHSEWDKNWIKRSPSRIDIPGGSLLSAIMRIRNKTSDHHDGIQMMQERKKSPPRPYLLVSLVIKSSSWRNKRPIVPSKHKIITESWSPSPR